MNGITVTGWVALNCRFQNFAVYLENIDKSGSIISLLSLHSFGRVVRRHEREYLLQRRSSVSSNVENKRRSSRLSTPRLRFRREAEQNDPDDPFSDTRRLGDIRESWESDFTVSHISTTSLSPIIEHSSTIGDISTSLESASINSEPDLGRDALHQNSDSGSRV